MRKEAKYLLAAGLCALALFAAVFVVLRFLGKDYAGDKASEGEIAEYEFLIGMSQADLLDPWRVSMNEDIAREATKYPDAHLIFTDAAADSHRQIEDVKMLVDCGIDLLLISPNESEALRPIISEVYKSIPVIVLDRDVQGDEFTVFIGPNNLKIGEMAGELIKELLGEDGGNVVEIQGVKDSATAKDRSAGFAAAIADQPNIEVIKTLQADWLKDSAEDRLKEYIITDTPKIDAIFAQMDSMAHGAYIAKNKLRVENEIFIVGADGIGGKNGGIQMVRDGILSGTFYCPTGGEQAITYAMRILQDNGEVPKREILEPIKITKQNAYAAELTINK